MSVMQCDDPPAEEPPLDEIGIDFKPCNLSLEADEGAAAVLKVRGEFQDDYDFGDEVSSYQYSVNTDQVYVLNKPILDPPPDEDYRDGAACYNNGMDFELVVELKSTTQVNEEIEGFTPEANPSTEIQWAKKVVLQTNISFQETLFELAKANYKGVQDFSTIHDFFRIEYTDSYSHVSESGTVVNKDVVFSSDTGLYGGKFYMGKCSDDPADANLIRGFFSGTLETKITDAFGGETNYPATVYFEFVTKAPDTTNCIDTSVVCDCSQEPKPPCCPPDTCSYTPIGTFLSDFPATPLKVGMLPGAVGYYVLFYQSSDSTIHLQTFLPNGTMGVAKQVSATGEVCKTTGANVKLHDGYYAILYQVDLGNGSFQLKYTRVDSTDLETKDPDLDPALTIAEHTQSYSYCNLAYDLPIAATKAGFVFNEGSRVFMNIYDIATTTLLKNPTDPAPDDALPLNDTITSTLGKTDSIFFSITQDQFFVPWINLNNHIAGCMIQKDGTGAGIEVDMLLDADDFRPAKTLTPLVFEEGSESYRIFFQFDMPTRRDVCDEAMGSGIYYEEDYEGLGYMNVDLNNFDPSSTADLPVTDSGELTTNGGGFWYGRPWESQLLTGVSSASKYYILYWNKLLPDCTKPSDIGADLWLTQIDRTSNTVEKEANLTSVEKKMLSKKLAYLFLDGSGKLILLYHLTNSQANCTDSIDNGWYLTTAGEVDTILSNSTTEPITN